MRRETQTSWRRNLSGERRWLEIARTNNDIMHICLFQTLVFDLRRRYDVITKEGKQHRILESELYLYDSKEEYEYKKVGRWRTFFNLLHLKTLWRKAGNTIIAFGAGIIIGVLIANLY